MAKYGKKASKEVKKAVREQKKGTLKSGKSGKKVKSRKQAVAIGLSKAWGKGTKEKIIQEEEGLKSYPV
ncbi:MAG: DUF6496 domain-containing protein [Anaerolineales bacterium]